MDDNSLALQRCSEASWCGETPPPPPAKRRCYSFVWNYFENIKGTAVPLARCRECDTVLRTPRGSTSALLGHLRSMHGIYKPIENGTSNTDTQQDTKVLQSPAGSTSAPLNDHGYKDDSDETYFPIEQRHRGRRNYSFVWKYFEEIKVSKGNPRQAQCLICGKLLKMPSGSTSSLLGHLRAIHGIDKVKYSKEQNGLSDTDGEQNTKVLQLPESSTSAPLNDLCTNHNDDVDKTNDFLEQNGLSDTGNQQNTKALQLIGSSTSVPLNNLHSKDDIDKTNSSGEQHSVRRHYSFVWKYFEEVKGTPYLARCLKCAKVLKCPKGGTSSLLVHLRSMHGIVKPSKQKGVSDTDTQQNTKVLQLSVSNTSVLLNGDHDDDDKANGFPEQNALSDTDIQQNPETLEMLAHSTIAFSSNLHLKDDIDGYYLSEQNDSFDMDIQQNAKYTQFQTGNTSPPLNDLHSKHDDDDEMNYFGEQSSVLDMYTQEIIALICSEAFISFKQLTTDTLKKIFAMAGLQLPTHTCTIGKKFNNVFTQRLKEFKKMIADMACKRKVFSLTIGEISSLAGRSYMCINLHENDKQYCLGMKRMLGNMPSDAVAMITPSIEEFGLNFSNVVGLTTDDTSVMEVAKHSMPLLTQVCIVHSIHLAVKDGVYSQDFISASDGVEILDGPVPEDDVINEFVADPFFESEFQGYNPNTKIQEMLEQVRDTTKFFKQSPDEETILQPAAVLAYNREVKLFLDCPGRWNSMVKMLRCFLKMVKSVRIANKPFPMKEQELMNLEAFCNALELMEELVLHISTEGADLLYADNWIKFTLDKLFANGTDWSKVMYENLNQEYFSHRNTVAIHLLEFLENSDFLKKDKDMFHVPILKTEIVYLAESLQSRMTKSAIVVEDTNTSAPLISSLSSTTTPTVPASVNVEFSCWMKQQQDDMKTNKECSVKDEIERYIVTHDCSKLKWLQDTLKTIRPSSVGCKRDLSSLKKFISRDFVSLEDTTINSLMFLRQFQKYR